MSVTDDLLVAIKDALLDLAKQVREHAAELSSLERTIDDLRVAMWCGDEDDEDEEID